MTNEIITSDLEMLLLEGDLSKLSAEQRLIYYRKTCESLGLNYLTQPFAYIKMNGKLALYARKDCTEQLRKINNISIVKMESKTLDGVHIVTVYARTPTGQEDISTGAVTIKGLIGEALANAFLKAETKAKRRVTLSICGLGLTDESEVDSIPHVQIVKSDPQTGEIIDPPKQLPDQNNDLNSFMDYMSLIINAQDMNILKELFIKSCKKFKSNPHFVEKLTIAKDESKVRLELEAELKRSPAEPAQEETLIDNVGDQ